MKYQRRTDLKLSDLMKLLRLVSEGIDPSARYMASAKTSIPGVAVLVEHSQSDAEKRLAELESVAGAMSAAASALLPARTNVAVNFVKESTHSICVIKFKGWTPENK